MGKERRGFRSIRRRVPGIVTELQTVNPTKTPLCNTALLSWTF